MDQPETKLSGNEGSLQEAFSSFSERVQNLNSGYPTTRNLAAVSFVLHDREVDDFAQKCGKVEREGDSAHYVIPIQNVTSFEKLKRRAAAASVYFERIPGFYIAALVEEIDRLIGSLVDLVLRLGQADNKLTDKSIDYTELLRFNDFEDAKSHLIAKEVDKVLRNGVAGQVEWFNSTGSKIPLDHTFVLRAIELGERRNCIVHGDSVANRFYIENCKSRGVDVGSTRLGSSLRPDDDYAEDAFVTTLVFGSMLFAAAWLKTSKKFDKDWDKLFHTLNDLAYDLMVDGKFEAALRILRFISDDLFKVRPTDSARRYVMINHALALKRTGKQQEANALLDGEDWRVSDHAFQAAVAAIRGKTDEALSFIRTGYISEQIPQYGLTEWPVFDHLRTLKKFRTLYEKLVGSGSADVALIEPESQKPHGPALERIFNDVIEQIERSVADAERSSSRPVPATHQRKGEFKKATPRKTQRAKAREVKS